MSSIKATKYIGTINNPTPEDREKMKIITTYPEVKYLVYQHEVGENGTPHIQFYIQFGKGQQRLSWFKKRLPRAHVQVQRGTSEQARDYCMKTDTRVEGPYEYGTFTTQGKRTDLEGVYDDIKRGAPMHEIVDNNFSTYVKYHKGIQSAKFILDKKKHNVWRNVHTTLICGSAGSGKTRSVYEKHGYDNVYKLDNSDSQLWFDGYDPSQHVLLIDDYYGWIKYGQMLNILDGHPFRCNVKGGHVYANWDTVYITSNKSPKTWYKQGLTPALERRIHETIKMGPCDDDEEFTDEEVNKYLSM